MAREGTPDCAGEHQPFERLHLQNKHLPHAPFLAALGWEAASEAPSAVDVGSKVMKAPGMAATKRKSLRLFMTIGFEGCIQFICQG